VQDRPGRDRSTADPRQRGRQTAGAITGSFRCSDEEQALEERRLDCQVLAPVMSMVGYRLPEREAQAFFPFVQRDQRDFRQDIQWSLHPGCNCTDAI